METISISVNAGQPRRKSVNGRDYLIADATLIVPGVLNGSKGSLYYPPDEVAKDPWAWNGMPIVGYHPEVNGQHVSGRDPDVLEAQGLGNVYRAKAGDTLNAELWFDVAATRNFDATLKAEHRILSRLENGKPIEISTGLFTDNHPAPDGSVHNGKSYAFIARNYRPDHLAVLPDLKGACSNDDGCGINVNADGETRGILQKIHDYIANLGKGKSAAEQHTDKTPTEGLSMTREQTVNFLTANCDCWKGKEKVLGNKEAFTDDDLAKLKANAEKTAKLELTVNEFKKKEEDDEEEAKKKAAEEEEKKKKLASNQDTTVNQQQIESAFAKNLGFQSVSHMTATLNVAKNVELQRRTQLVQQLVGNIADDKVRQDKAKWLMAKEIGELEDLVTLIPVRNEDQQIPIFNYAGAAGGMTVAGGKDDSQNFDPDLVINWDEAASA